MAVTLEDIERLGEAKMDDDANAYVSIGAGQEQTLRDNKEAFKSKYEEVKQPAHAETVLIHLASTSWYRFRPRILVDVEAVNTSTTVLGRTISFPVGLSPSAALKLANPVGEIGTAQAAQDAGTVMILSCLSTVCLEDVRKNAPDCVLWQQVYIFRDRFLTESLVKRAVDQGYAAIVLTVDSPVPGDRVARLQYLAHLPEGLRSFANVQASFKNATRSTDTDNGEYPISMDSPAMATYKDLQWLCAFSDLPVVAKGVLTAEAAVAAYHQGAAAVMVSNHGGRQLDGTPATIDVLPEVVAAVGDRMEVYLDGGVRTGADVVKALSLGARAVFVGRPVLWGLAYDGKRGVDKVLTILRQELERTIRLLGCPDINDLCEDFIAHECHCLRPLRSTPSQ